MSLVTHVFEEKPTEWFLINIGLGKSWKMYCEWSHEPSTIHYDGGLFCKRDQQCFNFWKMHFNLYCMVCTHSVLCCSWIATRMFWIRKISVVIRGHKDIFIKGISVLTLVNRVWFWTLQMCWVVNIYFTL